MRHSGNFLSWVCVASESYGPQCRGAAMSQVPVITIDGPVSLGIGTVAAAVVKALGWHLLDSGAIYRVLGYYAQSQNVALDDEKALVKLAKNLPLAFQQNAAGDVQVFLADEDVGRTIRQESV